MKIRQKLVVSFSSILITALIVLAAVFYSSIAQDIEAKRQELDNLKCQDLSSYMDSIVRDTSSFMERYTIRNDVQDIFVNQTDSTHNVLFYSKSSEFVIANKTVSAVSLVTNTNNTLLHLGHGSIGIDYRQLLSSTPVKIDRSNSRAYADGQYLRLAYPHFDMYGELLGYLFFHIPEQNIYQQLDEMLQSDLDDKTAFLITRDGNSVFTFNQFPGSTDQKIRGQELDQLLRTVGDQAQTGMLRTLKYHIFSCKPAYFDLTVHYIVPYQVYWKSVYDLRNHLIVAMLLILIASLAVIVFLSSQMTKPITTLVRATHDMIDQDYSTPLESGFKNDELGDLARRFEVMRQKVKGLIQTDPLTKLYNRRYLMSKLEVELERNRRTGHPLSCIMADVDFFKKVNDTYGHQCGDEVLKVVAGIIQDSIRVYDVAGRYGGEEFLLILPETSSSEAKALAERIRQTTQNTTIPCQGHKIKVTMSLGICGRESDTQIQEDIDILQRADEALYAAKESGRNRTVIFHG